MNPQLLITLVLLSTCVLFFVLNKPRMDVVALLAVAALPLTGVVTVNEALSGFGDPIIVLIAALFVIGEGLLRTGVAYRLSDSLTRYAGKSETRIIILLMLAVALLGSIMSSTGVVAIFIPVALGVARKMQLPPGRLMMPLSFAGLISGMLTLVGTPPNLVIDSALKKAGHSGLAFFSITPLGLIVLALSIGYMAWAKRWLTSTPVAKPTNDARGFSTLIKEYHLASREHRLRILPGSPVIGRTLEQLTLRKEHDFNIVAIERDARFGSDFIHPVASTQLQAGDILLVDTLAPQPALEESLRDLRLAVLPLTGAYFSNQSRRIGMAEVAIPPESTLAGRSVRESEFRRRHGLHVIGLRRAREGMPDFAIDEKIRVGDTLLVIGPWKAVKQLQRERRDFLVLSLPPESAEDTPVAERAPYALFSLGVMVVLMVTGAVPNVVATLIAGLLMGALGCIDMPSAYRSIHWPSLVLIAGMMPFALALERTGGVGLAVNGLTDLLQSVGPRVFLACLFLVTMVTGLFISNTVTAVLMAPIALTLAQQLNVSPIPFALTVAMAASTAFITPISSPVNTLVVEPGNYRFGDFVKIGTPFALLVMIVTVILVPIFYPF